MSSNDQRALTLLREWGQLDVALNASATLLEEMGVEDEGAATGIPHIDAILHTRFHQSERKQDIEWLFRKWVAGEDIIMVKLKLDKLLNSNSL